MAPGIRPLPLLHGPCAPRLWHDLAAHHDFAQDLAQRRALVAEGVYLLPLACKQGSISLAHSREDVDVTLERTDAALRGLR
jgi:glutamate-1-semialdehyde 2,1-aminomutase